MERVLMISLYVYAINNRTYPRQMTR